MLARSGVVTDTIGSTEFIGNLVSAVVNRCFAVFSCVSL
jgi:hypothetical protein